MDAVTAAPELLIASLRPVNVLLLPVTVTEELIPPTVMVSVPVPMAAVELINKLERTVFAAANRSTTIL